MGSITTPKKTRRRYLPAKKRKTFRALPSTQLVKLIRFANLLREAETDLWPLADRARLIEETLKKDGTVIVEGPVLWEEALRQCLEGVPKRVRAFITRGVANGDSPYLIHQLMHRYENLRISLSKLSSLAHANKLILRRKETAENAATIYRTSLDRQLKRRKFFSVDDEALREIDEELYKAKITTEALEEQVETFDMDLNRLKALVQSIGPTIFSSTIGTDGSIRVVTDMFTEAIEGVGEAALRLRECVKCPMIFWAYNRATVVCPSHLKARKDERRDFGTKKAAYQGQKVVTRKTYIAPSKVTWRV